MTCAPTWFWHVITAGVVLLVVLQLVLIFRSQTPARHAAEAAYELRETRTWLGRIYGVPADTTHSDFLAFMQQRRRNGAVG